MSDINKLFGDYIYSYTRKQAIEDGVLVDLSQFETISGHWTIHVACTSAVWAVIDAAVGQGRELAGVLHDICAMAKTRIGKERGETLYFECQIGAQTRSLKLHCGPGDTPIPVLTLMFSNED